MNKSVVIISLFHTLPLTILACVCVCVYTSVCAPVSLQLVGAGEPFPTVSPGADKRPLARVPAQVCPQVRRLPINLPTACDVADVLLLLTGVSATYVYTHTW